MDQAEYWQMPIEFRYKKVQVPESLMDLCLRYVSRHLDVLDVGWAEGYMLHKGLVLPAKICESLIEMYQNIGGDINNIAGFFRDVIRTNLRSVHVHNSSITDDGLECLLQHNLYELTLTNCPNLTYKTYINIMNNASKLRSLTIGPDVPITRNIESLNCSQSSDNINISKKAPDLTHLALQVITDSLDSTDNLFLHSMLDKLLHVRVLDLSYYLGVGSFQYLSKWNKLSILILHDVPFLQGSGAITNICALKSLVVLDLSQTESSPDQGVFSNENQVLAQLMECLPNLKSLDISGTNLAGNGITEPSMCVSLEGKTSDIPGLQCRVDKPLEFLGLYRTMHKACERQNIPAKIISGDANEEQILNAGVSCMNKTKFLKNILNEIHKIVWHDQCTQMDRALDIILESLTRHAKEKEIQFVGIASLFSIGLSKKPLLLNDITVKRRIITILLTGMEYHICDENVIARGCLTLSQMRIPQDIIFEFKRLIEMVVHIVSYIPFEGFIRRVGVYLLQAIAFQANNEQNNIIGDSGAIEKVMALIRNRFHQSVYDSVLCHAWSILMNVVDRGNANNCKRFLDANGITYFLGCSTIFSSSTLLMMNMIGVFESVVQVEELRPRLMNSYFIKMLSDLLFYTHDRYEVSYCAAGVISLLAADGLEAWTITHSRRKILKRMTKAIKKWNLNIPGRMDYHSLVPMLQLVQIKHTPQCALWATWTIANLTRGYPEKFCPMLIKEGGLEIVNDLLEEYRKHPNPDNEHEESTRILAQIVIYQCQNVH